MNYVYGVSKHAKTFNFDFEVSTDSFQMANVHPMESKCMNSDTDTIRATSSSQHQRERQTNTNKQRLKNKWPTELAALTHKKVTTLLPKRN